MTLGTNIAHRLMRAGIDSNGIFNGLCGERIRGACDGNLYVLPCSIIPGYLELQKSPFILYAAPWLAHTLPKTEFRAK